MITKAAAILSMSIRGGKRFCMSIHLIKKQNI